MIELSILSTMILALIVAHIWPHIRLEKRLHLPDSWEPESSRGRVVVHGGGFRVSGARVCR